MDAIYKTMYTRQQSSNGVGSAFRRYNISETGLVRGPFGLPDAETIGVIVDEMIGYFKRWSEFPNAPDYDTVEALREAKSKVIDMNMEVKNERIKSQIAEYREKIKAAQNTISDLERTLNNIYEAAADAMNLLEENGVDVSNAADWTEVDEFPSIFHVDQGYATSDNATFGVDSSSSSWAEITQQLTECFSPDQIMVGGISQTPLTIDH
jgi:hypothetical protein